MTSKYNIIEAEYNFGELFYENLHDKFKEDPTKCICRGEGWVSSPIGTWHKCPRHWDNHPHPDKDLYTNPEWDPKDKLPF